MSTQAGTLACGADLGAIVRQVTEQAPAQDAEHQLSCPYCQAALRAVRRIFESVRDLASVDIPVPASFAAGIMDRLRSDRRAVEVSSEVAGQTAVTERLVARVAREAAGAVPGVLYASASAASDDPGPGVATREVRVRVRLVAELGPSLPALADDVRLRVAEDVERMTGLVVLPVEVHVDDLLD